MGQLIDISNLGGWLLLALAPGTGMLVWLLLAGLRRNAVMSGKAVEPLDEIAPARLEAFALQIEQLNGAVSALGQALGNHHATSAEPVEPGLLPVRTGETSDRAGFLRLADKLSELAELSSRMVEGRHLLAQTASEPGLPDDNAKPYRPYLSFKLGDDRFAISTSNIYAIVEASQLITKPASTSKLRRAIRLRNTLVPVIDLGYQLTGRTVELGWSTSVVILEMGTGERMQRVGVVVDGVGRIVDICAEQIERPLSCDSRMGNDFILGTTSVNDITLTVLDIERGFSANECLLPRPVGQSLAQASVPT